MSTLQQPPSSNSVSDTELVRPAKDVKPAEPEKKAEKSEKADPTPLFWRMFGASCMSIAASLAIVLYFQVTQHINALRADVTLLREGYIQLVPKSEFSKGHAQVTAEIQTLQAKNLTALEIWTSRVREQERKIERMRNEHKEQVDALQRDIQQLRERLAVLESRSASSRPKN
jgi:septal ring factor EnvC (AmiA/AmiB activator)